MSLAEKLTMVAENIPKVYESGVADGKQAEHDAFWDTFQNYGKQNNYSSFFRYEHWNDITFRPKYDLVPTSCALMFDRFGGSCNLGTGMAYDLSAILEECGVVLDTSKATNFNNMFYFSSVKRVPTLDTRSCSSVITGTFGLCGKLETIDKIILKEDGSQEFSNFLQNTTKLKNIVIEGTIGSKGFAASESYLLSKASIISIMNALSTTTSNLSITLSKTAVNNAFETSTGAADGSTSQEWLNLIATKPNWTISLV